MEPVEYCERRFLEACDIGLGNVDRAGGVVISGGRAGCPEWDETAGGEVAGDELEAMIAVMRKESRQGEGREGKGA
jgi:hypothetical protein